MDRPTHAGGGAARGSKTHLTVSNLHAVSKAKAENNVTKNSSPNGPHRNNVCVPSQKQIEIESGFSTPQRTLTPQSSCTDLESASSNESSLRDVEPEVERQDLPSWLQPAHAKSASLRQRGRQMATTPGSQQDNLTRTNLRARGNAVLARCSNANVVPVPLEHTCIQAAVTPYNGLPPFLQPRTTAPRHPELAEQAPMKVSFASLASSGMSFPPGLAPPPGLAKPSTTPL